VQAGAWQVAVLGYSQQAVHCLHSRQHRLLLLQQGLVWIELVKAGHV
jgi:hypothetical protein